MLCRTCFDSNFFSAFGKYSVRCVAINSDGGRWPKKLRNFLPELRNDPGEGELLEEEGCARSEGRPGLPQSAPSPDMTLIVLARFVLARSLLSIGRERSTIRPLAKSAGSDPPESEEEVAEGEAGSIVVEGISIPR